MDGKPFPGPEEGSPYSGPLSRSPLPNGAGLTVPPGCCSVQLDAGTPYRPTALQGVCSECPCAQTERRQQAQGVLGMLGGGCFLSMPACFSMVWALRTQCAEQAHCWSPSRRLPLQGRLLLPQSSCLLRHTSLRTNDPIKCLLKRAPSPNFVKAGAGVVKGGAPQLWNWVLCNIILLMCLFFCLKLTSDLPPKPQPSPCTLPCAAPPHTSRKRSG